MDLLIDIGNTSLKWALSESGVQGEMRVVRHHGGLPIDLHATWEQMPLPQRVLVSNVGGKKILDTLRGACRSYWGRDPLFARTEPRSHGVTIAYERPDRLGVDRWLALLAAHQNHSSPVLVVDAGTAVTYDLLLPEGRHLGGLILPGIEMMRDSLLASTHIPRIEPEGQNEPWGTDTATAIAAGSIHATAALAEHLYDRLAVRANAVPELVVTGGDADRLLGVLSRPATHQPDLVLQGLALLA